MPDIATEKVCFLIVKARETRIESEAVREADGREDLLHRLAGSRGFYVPSFYDVSYGESGAITAFAPREGTGAPAVVQKAALRATDDADPPHTMVFTPDTEFGSRLLIEVVRGCANLCRFCWAGYNYLPVRAFSKERILRIAEAARPHANRVGLVSIALCDHPEIERILSGLLEMGYQISPASLRLADLFAGCGTFALPLAEAGARVHAVDADQPGIAALAAAGVMRRARSSGSAATRTASAGSPKYS